MKLIFVILLISFGIVTADVAHLERNYLPPARLTAFPGTQSGYSGSRTVSYTADSGYSGRLTQAAPVIDYNAPETSSFTSTNFATSSFGAPARYTAPAAQTFVASVPQKLVALPAQQYIAPASQKYVAPAPQHYVASAAQQYFAPAPQRYVAPAAQKYIAPAPQSFALPAHASASAAFTAKKYTNAQIALPSREYLSPEVETFEPLVSKQSYTAPAVTYNAPASSSHSSAYTARSNGIETQYSSDGGYVY